MALMVKNLPVNAGDVRDGGLIPESGRSPGGGNGNPLQYSRLKISMDRGAWGATVHGVGKNRISLSMRTNTSAGAAGEKRGSHRVAWDFQETSGKGDDAMWGHCSPAAGGRNFPSFLWVGEAVRWESRCQQTLGFW